MSFESPVTVFAGENGSGKSTLLKALAIKLNLPTIGSIDLEQDETLDGVKDFGKASKPFEKTGLTEVSFSVLRIISGLSNA